MEKTPSLSSIFGFTKFTIFFGFFIVLSSSFTRQVMNFIKDFLGEKGFLTFVGFVLLACGVLFLFFLVKAQTNLAQRAVFIIIASLGLFLTWQIELPAERIHILEFAALGWLASRDAFKNKRKIIAVGHVIIFTFFFGFLDEGFQAILPYRYYDLRDIVFNYLGALWGLMLFLLI
tara:strand:+ start:370 stop:894 length:525 start_codon:yes stop_codon:yes gene_type:complete